MEEPQKRFQRFFRSRPVVAGQYLRDLSDWYTTQCPVCGGGLPSLTAVDEEFDNIIASIARDIYTGKVKNGTIPRELYEKTADQLMKGVFSGLGGKAFGYEDPNNTLAAYLRQNVYAFSAAKSLTQMAEFNALLIGDDGNPRSQADFTNKVAATGALFNKVYLATERNSAIANAQMAQQWDNFREDETLQVSTVGDDKVRPWHARLDGFTALKSDPVWQKLWPPFDWNCRCTVVPGVRSKASTANPDGLLKDAKVPRYFRSNSGLTRTVFNKQHPYIQDHLGNEKDLTAEDTYAMQSVKTIYANNDFAPADVSERRSDANTYWTAKTGSPYGSFTVKDRQGITIALNNNFRTATIDDETFNYIGNCEDIIRNPDEVWTIRDKKGMRTTYLKFYEGNVLTVTVNETEATTLGVMASPEGEDGEKAFRKIRKGVLIYRKN